MKKTLITLLLCLVAFAAKADSNVRSLRLAISTPCEMSFTFDSPIEDNFTIDGAQLLTYTNIENTEDVIRFEFYFEVEEDVVLNVYYPTGKKLMGASFNAGSHYCYVPIKSTDTNPMVYFVFQKK